MKILFTGGGTGGHFFPIIAIAQSLNETIDQEKIVGVELFYMSDSPYDEKSLFENGIAFRKATSGKIRTYFSFKNVGDSFKVIVGIFVAVWKLFLLYPDVVVGKGGYASFPALFAARFLKIPVIVHESDTTPGRVNLWAGKFAKIIFVSHRVATKYFPPEKVFVSGNPIRKELAYPIRQGARAFLKLEEQIPVIFIMGGSQGSVKINDTIIDILPELVKNYQVIHQTGADNLRVMKESAASMASKIWRSRRLSFSELFFINNFNTF